MLRMCFDPIIYVPSSNKGAAIPMEQRNETAGFGPENAEMAIGQAPYQDKKEQIQS
jgi:hypothetical protein